VAKGDIGAVLVGGLDEDGVLALGWLVSTHGKRGEGGKVRVSDVEDAGWQRRIGVGGTGRVGGLAFAEPVFEC